VNAGTGLRSLEEERDHERLEGGDGEISAGGSSTRRDDGHVSFRRTNRVAAADFIVLKLVVAHTHR